MSDDRLLYVIATNSWSYICSCVQIFIHARLSIPYFHFIGKFFPKWLEKIFKKTESHLRFNIGKTHQQHNGKTDWVENTNVMSETVTLSIPLQIFY